MTIYTTTYRYFLTHVSDISVSVLIEKPCICFQLRVGVDWNLTPSVWTNIYHHSCAPMTLDKLCLAQIFKNMSVQFGLCMLLSFRCISHVATTQLQYISNILTNCMTCLAYTWTRVLLYFYESIMLQRANTSCIIVPVFSTFQSLCN